MVADIGCSAGELEDGLHEIWLGSWVFMAGGLRRVAEAF